MLHETLRSPPFSWEDLVVVASEQGVSAMLSASIDKYGLGGFLPPDLIDYFDGMETLNGQRNERISRQIYEVAAILNGTGINPIFLKGAGNLIAGLYDRPSHRVMIDIDVLVPHDLLPDCVTALKDTGYREHQRDIVADPRSHHYPALFLPGRVAPVELHSEAVAYPHSDLLPSDEVVRDALHLDIKGATFAVPSAEHRIVHTVAHSQVADQNYLHGFIMMRQLVECLLLQRSAENKLDVTALEARFAAARVHLPFACQVLALNDLFDADWPVPRSCYRIAWLFHKYGHGQIGRPRTASFLSRLIKPVSLLMRSLSDHRLRARLLQNLFKPAWLRRHWKGLLGK